VWLWLGEDNLGGQRAMIRYFSLAAHLLYEEMDLVVCISRIFGNSISHSTLTYTNQLNQTPSKNQLAIYYISHAIAT
jgi:hypothetical protein